MKRPVYIPSKLTFTDLIGWWTAIALVGIVLVMITGSVFACEFWQEWRDGKLLNCERCDGITRCY